MASPALRAAWCHKWLVHRRVPLEAFGGRIHSHVTGAANYPIHSDVLNSAALKVVFSATGAYLLPMAYPVGPPLHPSYPAAQSGGGPSRVPYTGASLTVGGELDKLASNIALGRNAGGVHYRCDGVEGIKLGAPIAISIWRDTEMLYKDVFPGFSFTKYDGTPVTISPRY